MSLVFFLFVTTLFLFFFANFVLSPERNPRFSKMLEFEHAPSKDTIEIVSAVSNGIALLITVGLIATVPFFRIIAAFAMLAFVGRFFYNRAFGTSDLAGDISETPAPELSPMEQVDADAPAGSIPLDEVHPE